MFCRGLKLWSTDTNTYFDEAKQLYDQKVFDYIELFIVPDTFSSISRWKSLDIPYVIHTAYFTFGFNLADRDNASENLKIYQEVKAFSDELDCKYIIFHGDVDGPVEETIRQLSAFDEKRALIENKPYVAYEYLENEHRCIGHSPEEIQQIKEQAGCGFCLDFGHAICSANSHKRNVYEYCRQFNRLNPQMYHFTDSKDIASPYDDHSHLGKGEMDLEVISEMIPDKAWVTVETKKDSADNLNDFIEDMSVLKKCFYDYKC